MTERRDRQPDRVDLAQVDRVDRVDLAQVDQVDRVAGQLDLAVCVQVLRLDLVRNQRLPIVVVLALVAGLVEVVVGTQDLGLVVAADLAALIEAVVADLAVADLAERYSNGNLRTTINQNLVIRWIPERQVEALYGDLAAHGLAEPLLQDVARHLAWTESRQAHLLADFG